MAAHRRGRGFNLDELSGRFAQHDLQAVLDCTSGWWSEQVWSGWRLLDVLRAIDLSAHDIDVAIVSVTGHRIVLAREDLEHALLATHVGGEVLSAGHGYPVRLVVPGLRGYHWVKWVADVELLKRPNSGFRAQYASR